MQKNKGQKMGKGHRKRLRDLVEDVGLDRLSIYQKMEYILYYVLPRVNTTEVAHELIDTFGDIHSVLEASVSDLAQTKGLGRSSAGQLAHLVQVLALYQESKNSSDKNLSTFANSAKFFYSILANKKEENIYAAAITTKSELLTYKRLSYGTMDSVTLDKTEILRFITSSKAKKIILAHNHPQESCVPSTSDDINTDELKMILNPLGIELAEHLIVGKDGVFSFKHHQILKYPLEKGVLIECTKTQNNPTN